MNHHCVKVNFKGSCMNIDDDFKNRISAARQAAELTQGELAEKVGVVRRQIAAYEAGDSKPRKNVLTNLAAALGTTSEWLAEGIGNAPDLSNVIKTITLPLIPVLSYSDSISNLGNQASFSKFIPALQDIGEKAFAYEIKTNDKIKDSIFFINTLRFCKIK